MIPLAPPPSSIATVADPASVREAPRTWRVPARGVLALVGNATVEPHAFSVEVSRDRQRVHLRGTLHGGVQFGPQLTVRIDAGDAFARECIARLFDSACESGEASALLVEALRRTLALHVFTRYAPRRAEPDPRNDRLAAALQRKLKAFIDARLDRRLSRTELARLAGYDARAFSFAFRNTFGMTPVQYVIERRLDRACFLIATTARDLADIAISTGFSSQSHLTSTLKNRRGITPLRLRRESARVAGVS